MYYKGQGRSLSYAQYVLYSVLYGAKIHLGRSFCLS